MILTERLGADMLRVKRHRLFKIRECICLIPFIRIVRRDPIERPRILRIDSEHFLEVGDRFVIVFGKLLRHRHIIKSLRVIGIDFERLQNLSDPLLRRDIERQNEPLQRKRFVILPIYFQRLITSEKCLSIFPFGVERRGLLKDGFRSRNDLMDLFQGDSLRRG